MGVRVEFWEVPQADIKQALIDDFVELKNWYNEVGNDHPEDIDYDLLEKLEKIMIVERLFEELDSKTIEDLCSLYLGEYCDYGPGKIKSIKNTSMLYISNYQKDLQFINQECSPKIIELWTYIITGRSITGDKSIQNSVDPYRFCIFSEAECQSLAKELEAKFDTRPADGFNKYPGIGSLVYAIKNKQGQGILLTIA